MKQDHGESQLRLDSKHALLTTPHSENTAPLQQAFAPEGGEQLQAQAAQLAAHLQARQTELNRREMRLNAFAAQLENEQRYQRLLASERERTAKSAADAEPILDDGQSLLTTSGPGEANPLLPSATANSTAQLRAEIDHEHEQLALREAAIAARETELVQQERQLLEQSQSTQLRDRERRLATEVAALASSLEKDGCELQEQRRQLESRRAEFAARVQAKEQALAAAEATLAEDIRQKTTALQQQQDEVTQHHAQLASLRRELDQLHHDSLNMRLETEELAQQLVSEHGEAVVSQTMTHLRARIAESFQHQVSDLKQRKREVTQLLKRLQVHEGSLQSQQHNLTQWAERREAELQRQAAKLITRERALDEREVRLRQVEVERQEERLAERNEIWALQRKLAECLVNQKKGGTRVPPSQVLD